MSAQARVLGSQMARSERSAARIGAVQALYQMEISGIDVGEVIEEFAEHRIANADRDDLLSGADVTFFAQLLRGVVRRQSDIDPIIDQQLAKGWRLVRVDSILRAILRAGVLEILECSDVPARVAINEYVDVAHAFFSGDEPRVVNGVLDRIARAERGAEFADDAPDVAIQ